MRDLIYRPQKNRVKAYNEGQKMSLRYAMRDKNGFKAYNERKK